VKILEPLVRRPATSTRYTLEDYAAWVAQSLGYGAFGFQGSQFPLGVTTTNPAVRSEPIGENFVGYVGHGLRGNGIVWSLELVRVQVFSQARFQFRRLRAGRPGELFGSPALAPLEGPDGGPNGLLLSRMLIDADMAGNFYGILVDGAVLRLRPDWVDVVVSPMATRVGEVGHEVVGYVYWPDGVRGSDDAMVLPVELVVHFAPMPDPLALFRGMSWLTPVVRELMADQAYTGHKSAFIENAATPNLAVSLKETVSPAAFAEFVDTMDAAHKGPSNAGKTLYLGGGADVTVVGADMQQLDFKVVQGAGETRIAAAAGVGAVIAQFSEGLQGSSLNAGNYGAARRRFADVTMRHLWQQAAASLAAVIQVPAGSHLWYDDRDISFLQEDAQDAANIFNTKMAGIRQGVDAGFDPASVVAAADALDVKQLVHSGLVSVQLLPPGEPAPTNGDTPVAEEMNA
jgi:hypothetical protein